MTMTPESVLFLCNFDDQLNTENESIKKLWSEQWSVNEQGICKELLATGLDTDALEDLLKKHERDSHVLGNILFVSVSSFLTFCDRNWNPHPDKLSIEEYFGVEWPKDIDANILLQRDSEPLYLNILYPELLYFSTQVFSALCKADQSLLHLWWYFRSKVAHQRSLEDTSATLYAELEIIIAKLTNLLYVIQDKPRLQILLCMEIAQAYLIYGRVQRTEEYLNRARDIAGLKLELTGILGKRTKFQQTIIPQLALSSELDSSIERPTAEQSHGNAELPPDLELQDDLRLSKIQYTESISQAELPSLEQILCLLTVQYLMKAQPKDELMNEELEPYIAAVLSPKKGAWPTRVAALLIRCKLEANHKRTVERAMLQCETIVNDKTGASSTTRLSYLWATGLQPAWVWRQQLADLYLNLGLVKAALEEYLKLQLWEDAAEIIQQQIDINPTVKLYCLLGDATDDVKCYEKAWEFSNHKSSRAQRHWGNFLFDHKKYEECIPHFEKSVEINSIQDRVWLRLGKLGGFGEGLSSLHISSTQHFRSVEQPRQSLWENVVLVSMDTGHFEDVIRGCHRLLDLQQKFEDVEVLQLLVRAILADTKDADGNSSARLQKRVLELFGRITSIHQNKPEIWQLYSDLSPTSLLAAQRLLKAYKGFTQTGNWSNNPETCKKVIDMAHSVLELSKKAREEAEEKDIVQANQQLSSARLTGQAVIRAVEKQNWPETQSCLEELKQLFTDVTEYMKSIM
ncbi:hypothetical protein HF086_008369 [Spodoptera exigua]|uniref:Tetratricopeptide repeat protein 27 n=1 Tax=Spodoptera exigua TaxID=7107 RepID=A0A922M3W3_SPOEX|nr:hypothetical protein HF086_008369 [Spodoptera exigua]